METSSAHRGTHQPSNVSAALTLAERLNMNQHAARTHTEQVRPQSLADEAITLVERWLKEAAEYPVDASAARLAGFLSDPNGLDFTVGFVDGVIRPEDTRAAARKTQRTRPPDSQVSCCSSPSSHRTWWCVRKATAEHCRAHCSQSSARHGQPPHH